MNYINRKISPHLLKASQDFPGILLTGPRQVGKTTLLKHLFKEYRYVSLDRPFLAEQASKDPDAFLKQNPGPLILDEVQYAPELFRFLKIKMDEQRSLKGQYILTGSQKFHLMKEASESLAGRIAIFELEGLSCLELLEAGRINLEESSSEDVLADLILRGGFPELWQDLSRPLDMFLNSYIATYLERDVRQVLAVGNLRDFERFLRSCALRSAQQLNKSDLARDVGISVTTAAQWLSVLEALGQVYLLEPWFGNLHKRLTKSPKLYLADPAILCSLSQINKGNLFDSPMIGAIWETVVYGELRKQLSFSKGPIGGRYPFWYYRDQSQLEVDFIFEKAHQLDLYECKWTSSPSLDLMKSMNKVAGVFEESAYWKIEKKKLITRCYETYGTPSGQYATIFRNLIEV